MLYTTPVASSYRVPKTTESHQLAPITSAVALILGIGSLIFLSVGLCGYLKVGDLYQLGQTKSIVMMAAGGSGCVASLIIKTTNRTPKSSRFADVVGQFHDKKVKKTLSGVYTLSNESGIDQSIQAIEQFNFIKAEGLKCHIGVGALHNFDIMAARHSDYGILFDFNPDNQEFINHCLTTLKSSKTPHLFVQHMIKYMKSNPQKYNQYEGYASPIARLEAELQRSTSWLYEADTQGKFQHIKKLAQEGKIVAITQDFCQTQAFQHLASTLKGLGCSIDTLYLSNLYAYLSIDRFYATFDILSQAKPLVIHCTPPSSCRCAAACQCPKEQHIGKSWKKVSKAQGAIAPDRIITSAVAASP